MMDDGTRKWKAAARAGWARAGCFLGGYPASAGLLLLFTLGVFGAFWNGDVTSGDTAAYFAYAASWAKKGRFLSPEYMGASPLYLVYFAWVERFFVDAVSATAVHHVLITMGTALASLAAVRRLLSPAWAWVVAAWWTALHWNAPYEVHQFGFALLMLGASLAGQGRSPWWRGSALAVLALAAALVRNELLPAVACFGLVCLAASLKAPRVGARWRVWLALALPTVIAAALAAALFSGNPAQLKFSHLRHAFEFRNRANLAQVYPYSYLGRRSDWQGNPWLDGASLMQRDFGQPQPSMREALLANPRAMMEHVAWNFHLLPAGLQVGLFGGFTGAHSPDYALSRPPRTRDPFWISLGGLAVWGAGAVLLVRWRRRHGRFFPSGSGAAWVWAYLVCLVPACLLAIGTQRPRPSYIFPLILMAMVFSVLSLQLVLREARRSCRLPSAAFRWLPAAVAVALAWWFMKMPPKRATHRPLADACRRVASLPGVMKQGPRVLCSNSGQVDALIRYLCNGVQEHGKGVAWNSLGSVADAESLRGALEGKGVTDLYLAADGAPLALAGAGPLPALALGGDWRKIADVRDGAASWQYWTRQPAPVAEPRK